MSSYSPSCGGRALPVAAHDDRAVFAHAVQHFVETAAVVGVQAVAAFVQQEQVGLPDQGPAQQEQAELPLRDFRHHPVQQVQGAQAPGHVFHLRVALFGAAGVEQGSILKGREQQFPAGDVPALALVVLLLVGRDQGTDGTARDGRGLLAFAGMPDDAAFRRPEQAVHEAHERGLAGAVVAQQQMVLAAAQMPVDVVQDHFLPGIAGQEQAQVFDVHQGTAGNKGGQGFHTKLVQNCPGRIAAVVRDVKKKDSRPETGRRETGRALRPGSSRGTRAAGMPAASRERHCFGSGALGKGWRTGERETLPVRAAIRWWPAGPCP